jgi:molecular chaperone GrpE
MEAEVKTDVNDVTAEDAGAHAPASAENHAGTAELQTQLEAERARADESHQKYLYALAELENFRKRMERQVTDRLASGKKATLLKFLPVLDNLERALSIEQDAPGLRGGLQATLKGFEALLGSEGVKPFEVMGEFFDPHRSEAVGTRVAPDVADETVVDVVRRGYLIGDEVLRPAQVIVAKHAAE